MAVRLGSIVALALALAGCGGRDAAGPPVVVLLTIDTLRADRLGLYGYPRPTSPAMDRLARDGAVFDTVMSTCPSTAPAVASIMTGAHRATHRVFGNGWKLPDEAETLAEILRAGGYRTTARIANSVLDASLGFAQGFDDFAMPAGLVRIGAAMLEGEPVVAEVETILAGVGAEPFFLWVHLMDPHGPYFPPESYRVQFPPDAYRLPDDADLPLGAGNFGLGLIPRYQVVEDRRDPADYRARYDAEIRFADDHVAAVLRALERHGLSDRALVVLTADHGESLGGHDYWFQHGWFLSDDALRVPLVIRGAGVPAGRRVRGSASTIDLAPTILDLLGLPVGPQMEGRSLLPMLDGGDEDRDAFSQTYYGEGLVGLRRGRFRYVFKPSRTTSGARTASEPPLPDGPTEEQFDMVEDPGERKNLEVRSPALRKRVQEWLDDQARRGRGKSAERPDASAPLSVRDDPQLERQLRALGYLE